ncbi:hypothetical protein BGW38_001029 [Lunasporangiospora selenospora]|uniref:BZIP domain-containing protein n=1 Tax=Lunasporangiospora selenospora TaxID=979761 RepID=A0A9P6KI11_9FUNG|nr:hypothetical protein BGW38_001029 [Lunasporangiospora selenospora]
MSKQSLDEYLELDQLLESQAATDSLFSFLFGPEDLVSLGNSLDLSSLTIPLDTIDTLDSVSPVVQTSTDPMFEQVLLDEKEKDIRSLMAHNMLLQQEKEMAVQAQNPPPVAPPTPTSPAPSLSNDALVQLLTSHANSTALSSNCSSAVPDSTARTEKQPLSISTVSTLSPSNKRPSPEPFESPRKEAKTESTTTMRSTPSTFPTVTSSTVMASSAMNSMGISSAESSSNLPINTTLSAATLQFLIQQQSKLPLIPHLFTGKLTRDQTEEILSNLLEATKYLAETTPENESEEDMGDATMSESDQEDATMTAADCQQQQQRQQLAPQRPQAGKTNGLKTQPGIKTDDIPSTSTLKKMTSKERRQLRNKISARNFRVRRKEYITTLEEQVEEHKALARQLREAVYAVYEENRQLKSELETVKQHLTRTTIERAAAAPASAQQQSDSHSEVLQEERPHDQSQQHSVAGSFTDVPMSLSVDNQKLLAAILGRPEINTPIKNNVMLTSRSQSTMLLPNLKKDVPNSAAAGAGSEWKNTNPVYIHTTFVPDVVLGDHFQLGPKEPFSTAPLLLSKAQDELADRPCTKMIEDIKSGVYEQFQNPFWFSAVVHELMQTLLLSTMYGLVAPEDASTEDVATCLAARPLSQSNMSAMTKMTKMVNEDRAKALAMDEMDRQANVAVEWEMQLDLWVETQTRAFMRSLGSSPVVYNGQWLTEQGSTMGWLYEILKARQAEACLLQANELEWFKGSIEVGSL